MPSKAAARDAEPHLAPAQRAWRLLALLAAAVVLVAAQCVNTSEWFPATAMAMFNEARDPNGSVVNTCLLGTTAADPAPHEIPFGVSSVGVARSDVEGNIKQFVEDPDLLAPLAQKYGVRHRGQPPLTSLSLCRRITHLRDGGPSGPDEIRTLATWKADG